MIKYTAAAAATSLGRKEFEKLMRAAVRAISESVTITAHARARLTAVRPFRKLQSPFSIIIDKVYRE